MRKRFLWLGLFLGIVLNGIWSCSADAGFLFLPTVKSTLGFMGSQGGLFPTRTVMSSEVEILIGIKNKSFIIGTRGELTFISQFTKTSEAGNTDVGGRMYGMGPIIGVALGQVTILGYFEPYRVYTFNDVQTTQGVKGFSSPITFGTSFRFDTHATFEIGLDFSYTSFMQMNTLSGDVVNALTYFNGGVSMTIHIY